MTRYEESLDTIDRAKSFSNIESRNFLLLKDITANIALICDCLLEMRNNNEKSN